MIDVPSSVASAGCLTINGAVTECGLSSTTCCAELAAKAFTGSIQLQLQSGFMYICTLLASSYQIIHSSTCLTDMNNMVCSTSTSGLIINHRPRYENMMMTLASRFIYSRKYLCIYVSVFILLHHLTTDVGFLISWEFSGSVK